MNSPESEAGRPREAQSLTRRPRRFSVAASPLNEVKLDLGLILVVAALVWLVVETAVTRPLLQAGLLAGYSLGAMAWLVVRTRRVVRRCSRDPENS